MTKKIIFSGGGTGGHIIPAINLMKHFRSKKYEVLLVTDSRGDNFIKDHAEFKSYILSSSTPTNKSLFKKLFSYAVILYSIIRSIIILKKEKPDLIFGLGGYVSFPISFASKFFKFPLVIYENNMVLGRANRKLLNFSKKILTSKMIINSFPEKYKNKIHQVGPILNKHIFNNLDLEKYNKEKTFSILVLGGSQGAKIFGTIIPSAIKMIKESGYKIEIKQQCLKDQKNLIKDFYEENNIKNYIFEFDKNILELILSSSLAITRCGASTIEELVQTLTPFIAIPLPDSIDNHQYLNAEYYEKKGCCWLLEQRNLNTKNLFNIIMDNIENKNKLENIRENMKKNRISNVYENIEKEVREFI